MRVNVLKVFENMSERPAPISPRIGLYVGQKRNVISIFCMFAQMKN